MKQLPIIGFLGLYLLLGFTSGSFAQTDQQSEGTRKVTTKVTPAYPQLARNLRLAGSVKLEVLVLGTGAVKSVQVKGGHPMLVQSAESAVRGWKWEKADHDTTEVVQFNFYPN